LAGITLGTIALLPFASAAVLRVNLRWWRWLWWPETRA